MNRTRTICIFFVFAIVLLVSACNDIRKKPNIYPSHDYIYVDIPSDSVAQIHTVYVPSYSEIYHQDGNRKFSLTTTLSIRNTDLSRMLYVFNIDYYDSEGKKIRTYLDSTLMLRPQESLEFVVEEKETESGVGANFIVNWGVPDSISQPVIQAVMIGSYEQQGISFVTHGVDISSD